MNIAVFGEDIFTASAIRAISESRYTVSLVVCPYYKGNEKDQPVQKIAELLNIAFIREKDVNSDVIMNRMVENKIDLILLVHLRKILKRAVFSLAKYGAINVHPSLLPKYRGLSPQHQTLMHGDVSSGVTIHFIDDTIDTGDIVIQQPISIKLEDYIYDYQLKMLEVYKYLIPKAIQLVLTPGFIPKKQVTENASIFGALRDSDRVIDLTGTAKKGYDLIRAVSMPYKGAICDNFIIWKANLEEGEKKTELMAAYPSVGIYKIDNREEIILRFSDGIILSDDFETIDL